MTTISTALDATGPKGNSGVAAQTLGGDFETFLQLLTAQISNQDPLAPMDSTTFVTQLAQLSQVEQAVATNSNLESIASTITLAGLKNDAAMIGKKIEYVGETVELTESGAEFSFQLSDNATDVVVQVLDADGTLLRDIPIGTVSQDVETDVVWDGKDDFENNMLPDTYKIQITGKSESGTTLAYNTYMKGEVGEVKYSEEGSIMVLTGGAEVAPGDIRSVG